MKRIALILAAAAAAISLFLLSSATANSDVFADTYPYLLAVNGFVVVALAGLVGIQLRQLLRDYLSGSTRPLSGGVLPHVSLIRPLPDATPFAGGGAELGGHRPANPYVGPYPTGGWSDEFVDMLGFTGPISPATADLITCDCTLEVIHVDGNGAPLDVGRSQRLFPPHIRRALIARDRGCAFPGCGRHPSWCDGHHIRPWDPDGVTSLDNGVLLCRRHHTMIHHYRWQVYLGDDRHPWFIPPPDPTHPHRPREHLRSHTRRTLTVLPGAA